MTWVAVGVAGASTLINSMGQAQQGIVEARRIKAQNKARIEQMKSQFELSTQNLHNNNVSIKQNKMKNDLIIEESKLDAQDKFAQAFIGSGISGRTQDIMEAQMQSSVSKAHNESADIATKEEDRQFLGLQRSSDKMLAQLDNMDSYDSSATESNVNMALLQGGVSMAGAYASKHTRGSRKSGKNRR